MSFLSRYARQSLASTRMSATAPLAVALPHWTRSFSNSSQNLKKNIIKDAPGWDDENATASEADVKADRQRLPRSIEELQKETIKIVIESDFPEVDGQPVKIATEKLNIELGKVGDKIGKDISVDSEKSEEVVENLAHRAQEAGAKLGEVTGTVKGKVEYAEEVVTEEVSNLMDSVKKNISRK
ncbi:hypothetical protein BGZ49_006111 [Haplosporangium sp. Z 27]|nr:hypothetical protein BGZ49_006111 [Haplosporangium sp. Z 27]